MTTLIATLEPAGGAAGRALPEACHLWPARPPDTALYGLTRRLARAPRLPRSHSRKPISSSTLPAIWLNPARRLDRSGGHRRCLGAGALQLGDDGVEPLLATGTQEDLRPLGGQVASGGHAEPLLAPVITTTFPAMFDMVGLASCWPRGPNLMVSTYARARTGETHTSRMGRFTLSEQLFKDAGDIARYLRHLGLPTDASPPSPARGPPFWQRTVLRRRHREGHRLPSGAKTVPASSRSHRSVAPGPVRAPNQSFLPPRPRPTGPLYRLRPRVLEKVWNDADATSRTSCCSTTSFGARRGTPPSARSSSARTAG